MTDIYAAGEAAIPGITTERLLADMKHDQAVYFKRDQESAKKIKAQLNSGDVFITLGAGDGWKLGLEVLQELG